MTNEIHLMCYMILPLCACTKIQPHYNSSVDHQWIYLDYLQLKICLIECN